MSQYNNGFVNSEVSKIVLKSIIENKKIGYGFGLTQLNEKSLINVQYALAFGQGLSNGKLHIKWISRL